MCLRLITDKEELKTFKSYDELVEFAMNTRTIQHAKKQRGSVVVSSKKEFNNWIRSL